MKNGDIVANTLIAFSMMKNFDFCACFDTSVTGSVTSTSLALELALS